MQETVQISSITCSMILCNIESLTKMRGGGGMFIVFVDLESDGEKSNYQ